MAMERSKSEDKQLDFSQPWQFSDAVLVVEEERLHVHRAVLAMSSPVFEKMFTSEFREKDTNEIPLPGKSSTEVKKLLLMIYPAAPEKQITEENCHFLVKLAVEYQMDAIVKRCEDFAVGMMKAKLKDGVLAELVLAQTYKLEKLKRAAVDQAYSLSLDELKQDKMYDQIQSENLQEIIEGIIRRLERELKESQHICRQLQQKSQYVTHRISSVRDSALITVGSIASRLVSYAASKEKFGYVGCPDTISCIGALGSRGGDLRQLSNYLKELKTSLETLQIS